MGVVYKAYQPPPHDRLVAIKFLRVLPTHSNDPGILERFRGEAGKLLQLDHPNIVRIYGYGEEGTVPYIVMELVEGGTLAKRMASPMNFQQSVSLIVQIAHALHYAHRRGIIHRDVKPANVLMAAPDRPVLSDFGIAKVLGDVAGLTQGWILGTADYMAPEQALGNEITQATDQYALGVVLYEMLAGSSPYVGDTPSAILNQHIYSPLPPPRQRNPAISNGMERVIVRALAKKPDDRFPDMDDFAAAVSEAAAHMEPSPDGIAVGERRDHRTPQPGSSTVRLSVNSAGANTTPPSPVQESWDQPGGDHRRQDRQSRIGAFKKWLSVAGLSLGCVAIVILGALAWAGKGRGTGAPPTPRSTVVAAPAGALAIHSPPVTATSVPPASRTAASTQPPPATYSIPINREMACSDCNVNEDFSLKLHRAIVDRSVKQTALVFRVHNIGTDEQSPQFSLLKLQDDQTLAVFSAGGSGFNPFDLLPDQQVIVRPTFPFVPVKGHTYTLWTQLAVGYSTFHFPQLKLTF